MNHETLSQTLSVIEEKKVKIKRAKRRLEVLKTDYNQLIGKQRLAYKVLEKENKDVDKIIGISISSFVATLLNNRSEKIEKEELEALESKSVYDYVTDEVSSMVSEIEYNKSIAKDERDVDKAYKIAFNAKKDYLMQQSPELWELINDSESKSTKIDEELKEISEAYSAAILVQSSADTALKELKSAKNLGVFDMLGGGLLVTMAKRSHMNNAQAVINRLNIHLKEFSRELKDVDQYTTVSIDIANYLTFADYFFDGMFMDIFVQNKINEVISQIQSVESDVTRLLAKLKQYRNEKLALKSELKKHIDDRILQM